MSATKSEIMSAISPESKTPKQVWLIQTSWQVCLIRFETG